MSGCLCHRPDVCMLGGACALYACAGPGQLPVAGCVGAAGWLPLTTRLPRLPPQFPDILLLHGQVSCTVCFVQFTSACQEDSTVEVGRAKYAAHVLMKMRVPVKLIEFAELGHTSNTAMVDKLSEFVQRAVGENSPFHGGQPELRGSQWGGVPAMPTNNCALRPNVHWICQNTRDRQTFVPMERAECLRRCAETGCYVVQYQHAVTGNTSNNWCHLYRARCKPGIYATEQSGDWCIEIIANLIKN